MQQKHMQQGKQMELGQTKNVLYSKIKYQRSEKKTYRLRKKYLQIKYVVRS